MCSTAPTSRPSAAPAGAPLLLPVCGDAAVLRRLCGTLAGLLLPGGGDVAPARYGQTAGPTLRAVDEERDEAELCLVGYAMEDDLPLLAICRGLQVLNVALGGTLLQDIPSQMVGALVHSYGTTVPRDAPQHTVSLESGSCLAAALGRGRPLAQVAVNSFHHQAVCELAPSLRVVARAPDGVVEALERPDRSFVIGVQWHPEEMAAGDPATKAALLAAFVAACERRRRG